MPAAFLHMACAMSLFRQPFLICTIIVGVVFLLHRMWWIGLALSLLHSICLVGFNWNLINKCRNDMRINQESQHFWRQNHQFSVIYAHTEQEMVCTTLEPSSQSYIIISWQKCSKAKHLTHTDKLWSNIRPTLTNTEYFCTHNISLVKRLV